MVCLHFRNVNNRFCATVELLMHGIILSLNQESLWRHGVAHDPAKKKVKVTRPCRLIEGKSFSPQRCLYYRSIFVLSQKLHPKKNQPWRQALRLRVATAASQAEANQLAAKLRNTTLE